MNSLEGEERFDSLSSKSLKTLPKPEKDDEEKGLKTPLKRDKDDELTSLSWLQNSNLLFGTALSPMKLQQITADNYVSTDCSDTDDTTIDSKIALNGKSKYRNHKSLTASKLEDNMNTELNGEKTACDPDEINCKTNGIHLQRPEGIESDFNEELGMCEDVKMCQSPTHNPKGHVEVKPPLSFSCLIFMAIENSTTKALPVKDIYTWIINQYPYYRSAPSGWKNSVRHNLSLNKCFSKVEKSNLGKGSLWMVDPNYRSNLLQAMSKAPLGSLGLTDYKENTKIKISNTTKFFNGNCGRSHSIQDRPNINSTSLRHCTNHSAPDSQIQNGLIASLVGSSVVNSLVHKNGHLKASCNRVNEGDVPDLLNMSLVPSEDVDAAAAMLALKHGHNILRRSSNPDNLDDNPFIFPWKNLSNNNIVNKNDDNGNKLCFVHEYKSTDGSYRDSELINCSEGIISSNSSSRENRSSDQSFTSDISSNVSQNGSNYGFSEFRRFQETDALLNLAAVATSLASNEAFSETTNNNIQQLAIPDLLCQRSFFNYKLENKIPQVQSTDDTFHSSGLSSNGSPNSSTPHASENGIITFPSAIPLLQSKKELSRKRKNIFGNDLNKKQIKINNQSRPTRKPANDLKISRQKLIRLKCGTKRNTLIRCRVPKR